MRFGGRAMGAIGPRENSRPGLPCGRPCPVCGAVEGQRCRNIHETDTLVVYIEYKSLTHIDRMIVFCDRCDTRMSEDWDGQKCVNCGNMIYDEVKSMDIYPSDRSYDIQHGVKYPRPQESD